MLYRNGLPICLALVAALSVVNGCQAPVYDGYYDIDPSEEEEDEDSDDGRGGKKGSKKGKDGGGPTTITPPGSSGSGAAGGADASVPMGPPALAQGIQISEVAAFQGVKVSLATNGQKNATRIAPVIAGRQALVRAYVTLDSGFTPRELSGELTINAGGKDLPVIVERKVISAASTDATLASTFNFDVPGASLTADAKFSVAIRDAAAPRTGTANSRASYPTSGVADTFDARPGSGAMKLVIVPVRYDGDGSQRLSDTSQAQLDRYKNRMMAVYPSSTVEVTLHTPVRAVNPIAGQDSNAWSNFLQSIIALRQQDNVAKDVYYYATFNGASTFQQYCAGGCITGLCSLATDATDASIRACIGVGFTGEDSADTLAHEIGHAHGRPHAPCGTPGNEPRNPDANFPATGLYRRGGIGVWGYDLVKKELRAPSASKDMMGYCEPAWISDYNFNLLFQRIQVVSRPGTTARRSETPTEFRFVNEAEDGSLSWGQKAPFYDEPRTDVRRVIFEDDLGTPIGEALAAHYTYGDLPGGFYLMPERKTKYARVRIPSLNGEGAPRYLPRPQ
jgi:hypothetical protein